MSNLFTNPAFEKALAETMEWIASRVDVENPRWCLRSAELCPQGQLDTNDPGMLNESRYIHFVTSTRSKLLAHRGNQVQRQVNGRLLLVDYEATNHNAATEFESHGFFDWADNPPWDLWIGEFDEHLMCWIPSEFNDLVERSMKVECMGMLNWAELET